MNPRTCMVGSAVISALLVAMIVFNAPRFDDSRATSSSFVIVFHNGVVTQDHTPLLGPSVHHALPVGKPHDLLMPLKLQDHHTPVRFRNIWIRVIADQ